MSILIMKECLQDDEASPISEQEEIVSRHLALRRL